jgi:ATP:ADP antiporter, AAA family
LLKEERARFGVLAALLFLNAVVLESNEVVATSGFVSRVGVEGIPWVWAADMLVVILTCGAYSLVVDRTKRQWLGTWLLAIFGVLYVALYASFWLGIPDWIPYSLLTVLNDQQWMILPMLFWALANDVFSTSEAKRLFPILAMAGFAGGVVGNGLTAASARWVSDGERGSIQLLLWNAGLLLLAAAILLVGQRTIAFTARQSRVGESVRDTLAEGYAFVREVPSYRYLAIAMVLLAVGLNVIEYQLIAVAATSYTPTSALETFYAAIRAIRICIMVVVQGVAAGWLLKRLGFESIFAIVPIALLFGIFMAFCWPAVAGLVVAEYVSRTALEGVDEPARRAFVGLVPDERRGRVSAFMDGYLYPVGSILSSCLIGVTLIAAGRNMISLESARIFYFAVALLCAATALYCIRQFHACYETSMLNWRLRRRHRGASLAKLDL